MLVLALVLAAVGGPTLAPLATFAAAWGWIEQKNEALGLLEQALNTVSSKIMSTAGYERRQLIAAAHTTIAIAAFFDSFREHIGNQFSKDLRITDAEKEKMISGKPRPPGQTFFNFLYTAQVPAPSASQGFQENVRSIEEWYSYLSGNMGDFLSGLEACEEFE